MVSYNVIDDKAKELFVMNDELWDELSDVVNLGKKFTIYVDEAKKRLGCWKNLSSGKETLSPKSDGSHAEVLSLTT